MTAMTLRSRRPTSRAAIPLRGEAVPAGRVVSVASGSGVVVLEVVVATVVVVVAREVAVDDAVGVVVVGSTVVVVSSPSDPLQAAPRMANAERIASVRLMRLMCWQQGSGGLDMRITLQGETPIGGRLNR